VPSVQSRCERLCSPAIALRLSFGPVFGHGGCDHVGKIGNSHGVASMPSRPVYLSPTNGPITPVIHRRSLEGPCECLRAFQSLLQVGSAPDLPVEPIAPVEI
jgi:hypothetical protein